MWLLALAPAVSIYYLNNFISEQSAKEIAFYNGFFWLNGFCMWHPSTSPPPKKSPALALRLALNHSLSNQTCSVQPAVLHFQHR